MAKVVGLLVLACAIIGNSAYADLVTPDYEIKFYLDTDKVLKPGGRELTAIVSEYFAMTRQVQIVMEFLDSSDKSLYEKGWVVRIRNRQDKPKLDIAYKYRIPVTKTITDALVEAEKSGWDSDENDYEYQVDWGYSRQTLSLTRKKEKINVSGVDEEKMELPQGQKARKVVIAELPGKLEKWGKVHFNIKNWAENILENARIYGPVSGMRHVGAWHISSQAPIIYIEVWNIAGKIICELSFKVEEYGEAAVLHRAMKELLQQKGWLLPKDVLKTRLILDSY